LPFGEEEVDQQLAKCIMERTYPGVPGVTGADTPVVWKGIPSAQYGPTFIPMMVDVDIHRSAVAIPPPPPPPNAGLNYCPNFLPLALKKDNFHQTGLKSGNYYQMNLIILRVFLKRQVDRFLLRNETGGDTGDREERQALGREMICPQYSLNFMYDSLPKFEEAMRNWHKTYKPPLFLDRVQNAEDFANLVAGEGDFSVLAPGARKTWKKAMSAYDLAAYLTLKTSVRTPGLTPNVAADAIENANTGWLAEPISLYNVLDRDRSEAQRMDRTLMDNDGNWSTGCYLRHAIDMTVDTGIMTQVYVKAVVDFRIAFCQNRLDHIEAADPLSSEEIRSQLDERSQRNSQLFTELLNRDNYHTADDLINLGTTQRRGRTRR
jgi:hypothetical protein